MTAAIGRHRRDGPPGFEHVALLHDGDAEFTEAAVSHAEEGLRRDEPVIAALAPEHLEVLHSALATDAPKVAFHDMSVIGRNPGRLIPLMHDILDEHKGRGRLHLIGENVWPERTEGQRSAAAQHEALMNVAFPDAPVSLLCPYDVGRLDRTAVALAVAGHPELQQAGQLTPSPTYDPIAASETAIGQLREPDDVLSEAVVFEAPNGPRTVRHAVADYALRAGLDPDRTADLCLAVHEIAVNTVMHTAAPGILSLWVDGEGVVCEIQDSGFIRDPLAGRYPAGPADGRGYGLFLVHQLCDLVRIHTSPDGTTVRVSMQLT